MHQRCQAATLDVGNITACFGGDALRKDRFHEVRRVQTGRIVLMHLTRSSSCSPASQKHAIEWHGPPVSIAFSRILQLLHRSRPILPEMRDLRDVPTAPVTMIGMALAIAGADLGGASFMKRARKLAFAAVLTAAAFPSGCMSLRRLHYRESQSMRTRSAWCDYDARFDCIFSKDFKAGWLVGYYDVVTGGTGIPPIVPPKKYWRPAQVIDKCDAGRLEWYRGFQAGAECAGYVPDSHDIKLWMPPACELACPPAELMVPPTSGKPVPSSESPETIDEPYNPSTEPPNAGPDESPMDLPTPDSDQIPDPNLRQEPPPRVPLDLPPKSQTDTPAPLKEVIADIPGSGPVAESSASLTLLSETAESSEGSEFYLPEPTENAPSDIPAITTVVSPAAITSVRPEPMLTTNPSSAAFSSEPRDFIVLKSPQTGSEVAVPIPARSTTQAARAMQSGYV